MAEQVAIRLRRARKKTTNVAIFIGYSKSEQKRPINTQMKIEPTQSTKTLSEVVIALFRKKYTGGAVRSIGVRYENFVSEDIVTYSLFDDVETIEKTERLERTIDDVRERFGFLAIQKASALAEGSRSIERSKLIGGHSAGGLDGLT